MARTLATLRPVCRPVCRFVCLASLLISASACTAIYKLALYGDLRVDTQLSESIFLDPAPLNQRTVYIQINDSSGSQDLHFGAALKAALEAKGYTISESPQNATYWLQANIKYFGETHPDSIADLRKSSYGSTIEGAVIGGVVGELIGGGDSTFVGAAVGGAAAFVTDIFLQDISYAAIVDVQISAKTSEKVMVTDKQDVPQGESAISKERSSSIRDRKRYRTRVTSTVTQLNLSREEAAAAIRGSLSGVFSGLL